MKGIEERDFVGVFDESGVREALGESGNPDAFLRDILLDIEARRLTFDIGIERENELFDSFLFAPGEEFLESDIGGSPSGNRRDHSAEDVVAPVMDREPFDRDEVEVVFDDAERRCFSGGIPADFALEIGDARERSASGALVNGRLELGDVFREVFEVGWVGFQQEKGEFGRRLFSDSREETDKVREFLKDF